MRQSSPAWPFRCNKRTFAICASTLFFTVFILRASVSREERLERYQSVATLGSMQPAPIIVAIAVSGAARGQAALRRFAASLRRHVILPFSEQQGAVSDAFLWLQDDGAEELLCSLLHQDLRICATRGGELRAEAQPIDSSRKVQLVRLLPPGSGGSADEGASIAADHPSEGYPADVWKPDQSPNTLRMLHKWRGVEALRQFTLAKLGAGGAVGGATGGAAGAAASSRYLLHTWVLRIRPDLELVTPLVLPPAPSTSAEADVVYAPWICRQHRLMSDQLLLLPASAGHKDGLAAVSTPSRLSRLYDPGRLVQVMRASTPPSLYPERLTWHAMEGLELRIWQGARSSVINLALLSGGAAVAIPPVKNLPMTDVVVQRDAYAKLRADFPGCFPR